MTTTPDERCRWLYRRIARECRREGLHASSVLRSAQELCEHRDGQWRLKSLAYKPTGVALGCPLPDVSVTRRLLHVAHRVHRELVNLCPDADRHFAYVPEDWHHITVVNRTHFTATSILSPLNQEEFAGVHRVTRQVQPFTVIQSGLLLSPRGVLLVPGFFPDDRFYQWRQSIAAAVPNLAHDIPLMAHLKLGHVLVQLDAPRLHRLLARVAEFGQLINTRLERVMNFRANAPVEPA